MQPISLTQSQLPRCRAFLSFDDTQLPRDSSKLGFSYGVVIISLLLRSAQSLRGRAPPASSSSSSSSSSLRFLSASSFSSSSGSYSRGFKPNHIWGSLVQTGAVTGISSMEAHSGGTSEVSATINLGAAVVALQCPREGLLSATLVDLKEKCMQVLGAHLQRYSGVSLEEEPDLDVLEESLEDEDDDDDDEGGDSTKKKPVEGAAPPPKKKVK